ncbi:hypothetical protein [Ferrimonas balearica]|uniref:hypothetical protein n=1 Tax=Ferrimonas balearica TaxID=44012 RepID=UPI001C943943|nr:hypothetical protein [Ferrimonas balearica]MBY6225433.1 hypothetical protein [Ferrimonas balearica]
MRATLLLLTLISGGTYAAGFGCTDQPDQRARLACYDQLAEAIAQCAGQQDQLDRLLCYDEFSKAAGRTVPAAVAPAADPVAAAPAVVAPQADPEAEFGTTKPKPEAVDAITSAVTKVTTNPYGQWTLTLENGQRWRQTESRRYKVKSGDTVTIERASLGSFLLSAEGRNGSTRVKRLD